MNSNATNAIATNAAEPTHEDVALDDSVGQTPTISADADSDVVAETDLVEDVSIDGMCGVY